MQEFLINITVHLKQWIMPIWKKIVPAWRGMYMTHYIKKFSMWYASLKAINPKIREQISKDLYMIYVHLSPNICLYICDKISKSGWCGQYCLLVMLTLNSNQQLSKSGTHACVIIAGTGRMGAARHSWWESTEKVHSHYDS